MPECGECGETFEDDEALVAHLLSQHQWDNLGRIDKKRIEKVAPERSPEVGSIERLRRRFSGSPTFERLPDVSRRAVVGGVGGVALFGGGVVWFRDRIRRTLGTASTSFRFATVSDGHYGQPDRAYVENHEVVFDQISDFDAVIHLGDIVNGSLEDQFSGATRALELVRDDFLEPLDVPYTVAHGNHDAVTEAEWNELFGVDFHHTLEFEDVAFVVLDSADERGEEILPDVEFLDRALSNLSNKKHVFVVSHYWFNPEQTQLLEQAGISWEFSEEATAVMHRYDNVRAFIHGHNHGPTHRDVNHLSYDDTELPYVSTGVFGGYYDDGTIFGYRRWEIDETGRIETKFVDLDDNVISSTVL